MAHQQKNNNKQSAVIFILIQLLMFLQQSQMTVLAILRMNALVRYFLSSESLLKSVHIKSFQFQLILRISLAQMAKTITEQLCHQEKDFFLLPKAKGVNQSKI